MSILFMICDNTSQGILNTLQFVLIETLTITSKQSYNSPDDYLFYEGHTSEESTLCISSECIKRRKNPHQTTPLGF